MKEKAIPLTRAAYKKLLTKALIKNGLSPEYYFNMVNLPSHDQENPESLLPMKPFWHILNLVATDAGIPDFGAQVAQLTPWHKVESLIPLIRNCTDLENLLKTICKIAPSQYNEIKFELDYDESELWFSRVKNTFMKNDVQMELYRMTSMIQLVQLAAGSGWFPEQIDLLMPENKIVNKSNLISKSHIIFSQARSGFPIPNILLKLPVNLEIPETVQTWSRYDINADFVNVVQHLIEIYISNKDCRIDEISRVTDIPIRTLQRRLKGHNTCFSDLLNQAKFNLAKDKLENSSSTIMEISYQLGYSDSTHFAHAFSRWAGMSPSAFRASTHHQSKKTG